MSHLEAVAARAHAIRVLKRAHQLALYPFSMTQESVAWKPAVPICRDRSYAGDQVLKHFPHRPSPKALRSDRAHNWQSTWRLDSYQPPARSLNVHSDS